jgi:hypothetical protein
MFPVGYSCQEDFLRVNVDIWNVFFRLSQRKVNDHADCWPFQNEAFSLSHTKKARRFRQAKV